MTTAQCVSAAVTHYVKYKGPGYLNFEDSDMAVPALDAQKVAREAPPNVDSFRFYDIVTSIVSVNGREVQTRSEKLIDPGGPYYINAEKLSFDELEAKYPVQPWLLRQLRAQGGDYTILCRSRRFQRAQPGDVFLIVD